MEIPVYIHMNNFATNLSQYIWVISLLPPLKIHLSVLDCLAHKLSRQVNCHNATRSAECIYLIFMMSFIGRLLWCECVHVLRMHLKHVPHALSAIVSSGCRRHAAQCAISIKPIITWPGRGGQCVHPPDWRQSLENNSYLRLKLICYIRDKLICSQNHRY